MTQIPILKGIYTDEDSDVRAALPRNLMPVPSPDSGVSNGYLRPYDGIVALPNQGPGPDRGSINWNGNCFRVMGSKLVLVTPTGNISILADVGGVSETVSMDYSFDRLAIASNGNLFYWDGTSLNQVIDPDLGNVVDMMWIDGYFMTTDGEFLIVTDLDDPLSVNPLRYGSSESDPDPIKALIKIRNEAVALNRHTIEVFKNVGGTGFPFQRIPGAPIQRGTIGVHTVCLFEETVAFLGGGRNEPISVWVMNNSISTRIATREIDQIIERYSEQELSVALLEPRVEKGHSLLYVHLPTITLVYDANASRTLGTQVWFSLSTGIEEGIYRARNIVRCYDKWWVGDSSTPQVGYLTDSVGEQWGLEIGWEFSTPIVYNEGRGAIIHELELFTLTGNNDVNVQSDIGTQYSFDGRNWGQVEYISMGTSGQTEKRVVWLNQGPMRDRRIQRFRGTSVSRASFLRLEARIEGLSV